MVFPITLRNKVRVNLPQSLQASFVPSENVAITERFSWFRCLCTLCICSSYQKESVIYSNLFPLIFLVAFITLLPPFLQVSDKVRSSGFPFIPLWPFLAVKLK